jgi:flagellar hook assembly protein FlgD
VQFEVEALNGRVVRTIAGGRAQAAGQQRLYWDGRSQSGAALPPGPYTVTLSARDDNGNSVQARRVITLLQ